MRGEVLGPYRIEEEIGSGGMGSVHRAAVVGEVPGLPEGMVVALKIVHSRLLANPVAVRRFEREARLGQEIRHPNVVRTYASGSAERDGSRVHFLVMELVQGRTLRDLLAEMGRLPERLCLHVARETARGLRAIHEAGIVHRDLKPENVLITTEESIKIMDLGIAHLGGEDLTPYRSGHLLGSVLYAAPEQFRTDARGVDARADLYALGVMLYEVAAGRHPYRDHGIHEIVQRHVGRPLDAAASSAGSPLEDAPLSRVAPGISPFYEEVVRTLRAPERSRRFESTRELLDVLEKEEHSTWWARRSAQVRRTTRRPVRRVAVPRDTPLFGRDRALQVLEDAYGDVRSGAGRVVFVQGEAGVGKTRLVDEFVGSLESSGEDVDFVFGSYPPGGAATANGALLGAILGRLGEEDVEGTLGRLLRAAPLLVPAFAAMLRGEPPPQGAQPLNRESIQAGFVLLLRALAAERPTILLVDDLHFAPVGGRELFAALAHATPGHRLLLVGTYRPSLPEDWLANLQRLGHVDRIDLDRLGPADLVRLLHSALASERMAQDLAGRIAVLSDGNPFFAFEILRGLREGRLMKQLPDGTWTASTDVRAIPLPPSVRDLIRARIAHLEGTDRDLLAVAACYGFEFDALVVGAACGLGTIEVLRRLAQLERSHRMVHSVGRRHAFDHHQIQEALYDELSPLLREAYHASIARAAEGAEAETSAPGARALLLCDHYLRGAAARDALRWLPDALEYLDSQYRTERAADLMARILTVPGLLRDRPRVDLLLRLATALDLLGRREEQKARLDEAVSLARGLGDGGLEARSWRLVGSFFYATGRYPEAQTALERALDAARSVHVASEESAAIGLLGSVAADLGRLDEAQRLWEDHLARARRLGDVRGEARATGNLGLLAYYRADHVRALDLHRRSRALFHEAGDLWGEGRSTTNIGLAVQASGDLEAARTHFEEALRTARLLGDRRGAGVALGNLGVVYRDLGLYRQALEATQEDLEGARSICDRRAEVTVLNNLARIWLDLGETTRARTCLEAVLRLGEGGDEQARAHALRFLGEASEMESLWDDAERRYSEALGIQRGLRVARDVAQTLVLLGRLLLGRGRAEAARAALQEAFDSATRGGFPDSTILARSYLSGLESSDAPAAVAAFRAEAQSLPVAVRIEAAVALWRVTGERDLLEAARQDLERLFAEAPPESEPGARDRVLGHREARQEAARRGRTAGGR